MSSPAPGSPPASPVATATQAVGLLAAIVAALYVLGGAVFALRLAFDHFSLEAIVALVGQLSRELLITVGLVEAVAPAALVGLCAALLYGAFGCPKRAPGNAALTAGSHSVLLFVGLAALALALIAPSVVTAIATDGIGPLLLTSVLGWAVTFGLVIAGWYALRRTGQQPWSRLARAAAAGGIWTAMALVGAVMLAAAVPFDRASICVESGSPAVGNLIADTKDRVILASSGKRPRRVVSVPSSRVVRIRYGDLTGLPRC